jgi:4-hydroxy-tetrahydrodipicolinate synthase
VRRVPFTGVGTALVTPFTRDGVVDAAAVRRLVRRQIDAGIHFVSPCGTTGEAPTLSDAEKLEVVRLVVDETAGRVPVLAGAGGYNTREVVALVREIEQTGANGILSVTPYYNKPTPEGLFQHYKAIADATPLPIVLYNVPGRTGVNLDVATVARLAQIPTIVGLKEASGNLTQLGEILAAVPPDFIVVSGDDPLAVASMAAGARGLISVASNAVPAEMVQVMDLCERGEFDAARRLEAWLMPLLQVNFVEANPIPIKAAMAAMGLLEEIYRLPLVAPSPPARARILEVLQDLKLLGSATRL